MEHVNLPAGSYETKTPPAKAEPEPGSFADLIASHLNCLYAAARRVSRSVNEAEDLVQETCLRAHKGFPQLQSHRKARAWLLSILLNQYRNRRRSDGRRLRFVDIPLDEALRREADGNARYDVQQSLELREALEFLPEELRAVVWLADAEGFTCREIARMLDLAQGTVGSRLYRARRQLRTLLGGKRT